MAWTMLANARFAGGEMAAKRRAERAFEDHFGVRLRKRRPPPSEDGGVFDAAGIPGVSLGGACTKFGLKGFENCPG